ncbi:DNA replication complex GINS protein PSF2 [Mayamaea pseudoterrestris]|nr:DNA replication complex GINS protein PSF2 [Mayamaea pseudoterrestris]
MTNSTISNDGLSSFFSAFPADDILIDIVPSLDAPQSFALLLTKKPIGPFIAGIATQVPLWLALFLHQRSLCQIAVPSWCSVENLTKILEFERTHIDLWPDSATLPHYYMEIYQRLAQQADKAVGVLMQDIFQVRCDKLQQQFQGLLKDNAGNLLVMVNGIASQELAVLRPFVLQALNDQHLLSHVADVSTAKEATSGTVDESGVGDRSDAPTKARVPIRRFRK